MMDIDIEDDLYISFLNDPSIEDLLILHMMNFQAVYQNTEGILLDFIKFIQKILMKFLHRMYLLRKFINDQIYMLCLFFSQYNLFSLEKENFFRSDDHSILPKDDENQQLLRFNRTNEFLLGNVLYGKSVRQENQQRQEYCILSSIIFKPLIN